MSLMHRLFVNWLPNLALVVGLVMLIRFDLAPLAVVLLLLSRWQLLLGGPKVWLRNLRSNGCDLIVGFSSLAGLVLFANDLLMQIIVATAYAGWLLVLKPLTRPGWVAAQAALCQLVGLSFVFLLGRTLPEVVVLALSWLVAATAADHFFSAHREPAHNLLVVGWALLVTELAWLLWRWLIVYSLLNGRVLVPQVPLVITIMGYSLGSIYLDHTQKKLRKRRLAEYLLLGGLLLLVIIAGTKWDVRL